MMILPYDVARCHGMKCVVREACARFFALNDLGPRTPVHDSMCDYDNPNRPSYFIPIVEKTND